MDDRDRTMRAAVYARACEQGVTVARKSRVQLARRNRHKVLVKIKAAGVNPVDSKFVFGDKLPECLSGCAKWTVEGKVPGFDFAGVVEETPNCSYSYRQGANALRKGDHVYGTAPPFVGTFCEYIAVPLDQVSHKPECLTWEQAATLPLGGLTCIQAFRDHDLKAGQRLLVIGASGGVGHIATQIAAAMDVTVVGICSTKNIDLGHSLGASHVLDYTIQSPDLITSLEDLVDKIGKFDMVLDTVTSHDSRDRNYNYESMICSREPAILTNSAHNYVVLGGYTSQWIASGLKRTIGLNCFSRSHELAWVKFPNSVDDLKALTTFVETHNLRPVLDSKLPLTEEGVQLAFRKLNSRRTAGKIALTMDSASDNGVIML
eukprot:m.287692 g.287692  ORF g.287692 m.287692 type:complete len:375 (+) comp16364_c0_seq1:111-1235(+)